MKGIRRWWCALALWVAVAAQAATPEAVPSKSVSDLRAAIGTHRLVLLGEMHGTNEAPALASRLATAYASQGAVTLVLEIHASEQAGIDRYLASAGGEADRTQLLAGKFWQVARDENDGRRNGGALALIEDMRQLRHAGQKAAVLAMDPGDVGGSQARDQAMAAFVRSAYARMPAGRMLVLTGNVHAMRRKPEQAPAEMQDPLGSRITDLDLYSVNLAAVSGKFWGCMKPRQDCGPKPIFDFGMEPGVQFGAPWDYNVLLPAYSVAPMVSQGRLPP